jgi:hypothetical protein
VRWSQYFDKVFKCGFSPDGSGRDLRIGAQESTQYMDLAMQSVGFVNSCPLFTPERSRAVAAVKATRTEVTASKVRQGASSGKGTPPPEALERMESTAAIS